MQGRCPDPTDPAASGSAPRADRLLAGRVERFLSREADLAEFRVSPNHVALPELALEQAQRERVLEQPLDRTLERSRTVGRVPACLGDQLACAVRQLEREAALGEPLVQPRELHPDDLAELLTRERLEHDDLVDPVQELGPEAIRHVLGGADVRGHDHDGVAEVDRAAVAVGQPSVVE